MKPSKHHTADIHTVTEVFRKNRKNRIIDMDSNLLGNCCGGELSTPSCIHSKPTPGEIGKCDGFKLPCTASHCTNLRVSRCAGRV